jgi:Flp pilus assembly CpaF family ATPase
MPISITPPASPPQNNNGEEAKSSKTTPPLTAQAAPPTLQTQPAAPRVGGISIAPAKARTLPVQPAAAQPVTQAPKVIGRDLDEEYTSATLGLDKVKEFTFSEGLINLNEYETHGSLTAEEVITEDYDTTYKRLESKIVEVLDWLREIISDQNRNQDVADARRDRKSAKFKEMKNLLDQLLVRHFSQDNVVNPADSAIVSAMVVNDLLGLGPLEPLWGDKRITEIMVNGPFKVRIEIAGKLITARGVKFRSQEHLLETCQQLLAPLNRTIDVAHPMEDGRLPDGSRINVTHPAVGPGGPYLTIRRFPETVFSIKRLVDGGSMTPEIATEIGNLIHAGCSTVIAGGTGSGKMTSHDTRIPTPFGMTTMGDLKVGEIILDENALPTTVTAKYSTKIPVAYELTFSDGTKVKADEDHNWFTSSRSARRAWSRQETTPKMRDATRKRFATDEEIATLIYLSNEREEFTSPSSIYATLPRLRTIVYNASRDLTAVKKEGKKVYYDSSELHTAVLNRATAIISDQRGKSTLESIVTTKEIFDTLYVNNGKHANHAIRLISQAVLYTEKELLISPYAFGAWLGDGHSNSGAVCGIDDEIFDNIVAEGNETFTTTYDNGAHRNVPLRKDNYTSWTWKLRDLGVLKDKNTVGQSKMIPDDYLYSSIAQRRALIAGMLDTDGTVDATKGVIQFANSNKVLIDGFRQVIHSLGYQSTLTSKMPTYTHKGDNLVGQEAYTVSFYTDDDVFGISRKQEIHERTRTSGQRGHRSDLRYIVDCQPIPTEPMSCITVDSPNSLYLVTDAFIPTHNTSMLNALSGCIPEGERVVTIEDNLELRLHPDRDVVALETRRSHQGSDGRGNVSIRDLVKNSLRMRPDRIIVGEVRDGSAYDMLQAMNTGHEGSMTTVHANDANGALDRLVNLISEVGEVDAKQAISLISNGVDIIVSIRRFEDGSRRVDSIAEIPTRVAIDSAGNTSLEPLLLWEFVQTAIGPNESVIGEYRRVNEISDSLKKKHRLDKKRQLTMEEIYVLSSQV